MNELPSRLYHIRKIENADLPKYMCYFYPEARSFDSFLLYLQNDVSELTALKHSPSFRKNKEYLQLIPRIQLGIKVLASMGEYEKVANIYRKIEANKRRLLGYGFRHWIYDLTILEDEIAAPIFRAMPDVYLSWMTYYKRREDEDYDIKSLAASFGRANDVEAINLLREIVQQAGINPAFVDRGLAPETVHVCYTDDEAPGIKIKMRGLVKHKWLIRPESECPTSDPNQHEPDPAQITSIIAQHRAMRSTNLKHKIASASPTKSGLYPHEIAALFEFPYWNSHGPLTPRAIEYSIRLAGIDDFMPYISNLVQRGFLSDSDLTVRLENHTVKDLSAYLKSNKLKCSGRKAELIDRIINNIPDTQIYNDFPVKYYSLTNAGQKIASMYPFVGELTRSGSRDYHWCGPRHDLWSIFELLDNLEGLELSDVAAALDIKYCKPDNETFEFPAYEDKDWLGEIMHYEAPDGTTATTAISAFCDRDCTPYDFEIACWDAMYGALFPRNIT